MTVLIFDSGVGGLSILREVRTTLPDQRIVYIGDDEGFPYGNWKEAELTTHIENLFERFISRYQPELAIVACNTASTLIMSTLRKRFNMKFVGTVPAIKPAAERTASGMISVLGTHRTIHSAYISNLVNEFAGDVDVNLVASPLLARMAEDHILGLPVDRSSLQKEISPCFKKSGHHKTDIVVLGCTHYPFLANEMRKVAPWPVDWLDPAEAIAQQASAVISPSKAIEPSQPDIVLMTSGKANTRKQKLLQGFGLQLINSYT